MIAEEIGGMRRRGVLHPGDKTSDPEAGFVDREDQAPLKYQHDPNENFPSAELSDEERASGREERREKEKQRKLAWAEERAAKKRAMAQAIKDQDDLMGEGYAEDEEQRLAAYEAEMARRKRNAHQAKEDKKLKKKYVEKNFPNAPQDFVDDQLNEGAGAAAKAAWAALPASVKKMVIDYVVTKGPELADQGIEAAQSKWKNRKGSASEDFVDDQLAETHDEGDPSVTRPGEEDYTGHKGDDSKTHRGKDYESLDDHLKRAVDTFKKDLDMVSMETAADPDNRDDPHVSLMNDFLANLNIDQDDKEVIYQELAEYYHKVLVPRAQREMPRAPIEDPFKDIAEGFKRFRK